MEEEKTIQEVAKTTGKALDLLGKVGGFLSEILGPASKEVGAYLEDWAKYFRMKNLLRIYDKFEAIKIKRRFERKLNPIEFRLAIPLIQNASQEDNDSLQEMWANLIANFTDPEKRLHPQKIYIEILSSLEPLDVKVLDFFARQGWKLFREVPAGGITMESLIGHTGVGKEEIQLSLQNLARLGCIADESVGKWDSFDSTSFGLRMLDPTATFKPTPLGFSLMEACGITDKGS